VNGRDRPSHLDDEKLNYSSVFAVSSAPLVFFFFGAAFFFAAAFFFGLAAVSSPLPFVSFVFFSFVFVAFGFFSLGAAAALVFFPPLPARASISATASSSVIVAGSVAAGIVALTLLCYT